MSILERLKRLILQQSGAASGRRHPAHKSQGRYVPSLECLEDRLTPSSLPFNDNFTVATNQQLSNNWLNQVGNFAVAGGVATGVGGLDVATVNGVSSVNEFVQADITVTGSGQAAGLITRYSGPADRNMYVGEVSRTGGVFQA